MLFMVFYGSVHRYHMAIPIPVCHHKKMEAEMHQTRLLGKTALDFTPNILLCPLSKPAGKLPSQGWLSFHWNPRNTSVHELKPPVVHHQKNAGMMWPCLRMSSQQANFFDKVWLAPDISFQNDGSLMDLLGFIRVTKRI